MGPRIINRIRETNLFIWGGRQRTKNISIASKLNFILSLRLTFDYNASIYYYCSIGIPRTTSYIVLGLLAAAATDFLESFMCYLLHTFYKCVGNEWRLFSFLPEENFSSTRKELIIHGRLACCCCCCCCMSITWNLWGGKVLEASFPSATRMNMNKQIWESFYPTVRNFSTKNEVPFRRSRTKFDS